MNLKNDYELERKQKHNKEQKINQKKHKKLIRNKKRKPSGRKGKTIEMFHKPQQNQKKKQKKGRKPGEKLPESF